MVRLAIAAALVPLLLLLLLVPVVNAASSPTNVSDTDGDEAKLVAEFEAWMKRFGKDKVYGDKPLEKLSRFRTFRTNADRVRNHNDRNLGSASWYKLGLNRFADMTFDEARSGFFVGGQKDGLLEAAAANRSQSSRRQYDAKSNIPRSQYFFDWRSRNVVTPAKDQGSCGKSSRLPNSS
jgi:hypothetical protein